MDYTFFISVLASTIRLTVPILLCCLGGLYSERSGVFDIGIEGKMLFAAFSAGAVASATGSAWAGLFAAIGTGILFSLLHGFASITQRGNQIVSGVAINFLAAGLGAQGNAPDMIPVVNFWQPQADNLGQLNLCQPRNGHIFGLRYFSYQVFSLFRH